MIKDVESCCKLLLAIPLTDFVSHHVHKLIKINCTTPIPVYFCYHVTDFLKCLQIYKGVRSGNRQRSANGFAEPLPSR
ncbi:hypothetical protein Hanom_Chr01g00032461 [Helianthus anomalus]